MYVCQLRRSDSRSFNAGSSAPRVRSNSCLNSSAATGDAWISGGGYGALASIAAPTKPPYVSRGSSHGAPYASMEFMSRRTGNNGRVSLPQACSNSNYARRRVLLVCTFARHPIRPSACITALNFVARTPTSGSGLLRWCTALAPATSRGMCSLASRGIRRATHDCQFPIFEWQILDAGSNAPLRQCGCIRNSYRAVGGVWTLDAGRAEHGQSGHASGHQPQLGKRFFSNFQASSYSIGWTPICSSTFTRS